MVGDPLITRHLGSTPVQVPSGIIRSLIIPLALLLQIPDEIRRDGASQAVSQDANHLLGLLFGRVPLEDAVEIVPGRACIIEEALLCWHTGR